MNIAFETSEFGIGDIGSIEIREEVNHADKRETNAASLSAALVERYVR